MAQYEGHHFTLPTLNKQRQKLQKLTSGTAHREAVWCILKSSSDATHGTESESILCGAVKEAESKNVEGVIYPHQKDPYLKSSSRNHLSSYRVHQWMAHDENHHYTIPTSNGHRKTPQKPIRDTAHDRFARLFFELVSQRDTWRHRLGLLETCQESIAVKEAEIKQVGRFIYLTSSTAEATM